MGGIRWSPGTLVISGILLRLPAGRSLFELLESSARHHSHADTSPLSGKTHILGNHPVLKII